MKKIKIIACFLLVFSLVFSEEKTEEVNDKAKITQLEQQIETQNKIIARYERLEDKLNDRVLETLGLNNKVDDFYNSAWNKLILVITGAFAGIGLLLPYLQNQSFRETKEKIEEQEKELVTYKEGLKVQREKLKEQNKELENSFKNLEVLRKKTIIIQSEVYGAYIHSELEGFLTEENEYELMRRMKVILNFSMKKIRSLKEIDSFDKLSEALMVLHFVLKVRKNKTLDIKKEALEVLREYPVECKYVLKNLNDIALVGNILTCDVEELKEFFTF